MLLKCQNIIQHFSPLLFFLPEKIKCYGHQKFSFVNRREIHTVENTEVDIRVRTSSFCFKSCSAPYADIAWAESKTNISSLESCFSCTDRARWDSTPWHGPAREGGQHICGNATVKPLTAC